MAIHQTPAIVLKRQDYRESSILATLFTRELGKIHGIAKGIRGPKSRFASRLEPFTENHVVVYEPTRGGDLFMVAQCDLQEPFLRLREDLAKSAYATYLVELVDATQEPHDPQVAVYELLQEGLSRLAATRAPDWVRRVFEVRLLRLTGFLPRLEACVHCDASTGVAWQFSVRLGGVLCPRCGAHDATARRVSRGAVATFRRVAAADWVVAERIQCVRSVARELGVILDHLLLVHLGRRPRSLEFLERVR